MRAAVLSALTAIMLAACGSPAPPASAPTATKPPVAAPAATPAGNPSAPATTETVSAPKPPPPEGDCGDQGKVPADQRVANTARWSTASEQDSFGFDIYRSDTEKGQFAKITQSPVLGAGTSDETHKYEYRDDSIDPCKDYWYYIEQISTKGDHEKITAPFHAPAKRRARGSAGDAAGH